MNKFPIKHHEYDLIIVGAGGAGLMAAVHAAQSNLKTAVISKVEPTRSHTVAAKGGINAALGNITKDDWRWHMYDTIHGGDWLGDQDAIEYMCRNAPNTIRDLELMGVPFSRDENGKIFQRIYGGQSSEFGKGPPPHRACSVADRTGHAILHTLYQQSVKAGVDFYVEHFSIDLIMENGKCYGVVTWDMENGEIHIFRSHMTILATGGYGQAYETNTSSSICTGDGNAMAIRAGIPNQDMEFIQFHPTGLYGSGFLITEAARSEGAYLINANGERFMERYAPKYKDLAARDVIARAMAIEIEEGRGVGKNKDHLLLCLNHLDPEVIKKNLPTVCENAKIFAKVDAVKEPIPVVPSAHYTMGGIPTNKYCEVISKDETIVSGLMAVGETACMSIHGANRLGCNSLLDIIVFGKAAVLRASELIAKGQRHKKIDNIENEQLAYFYNVISSGGTENLHTLQSNLKKIMSKYAGISRNKQKLEEGKKQIKEIISALSNLKINDKSLIWNSSLLEALELHNIALQSIATIESALKREESRGSHLREDFPERNDKDWLKHTIFWQENSEFKLSTRNVRITTLDNDIKSFTPEKREY